MDGWNDDIGNDDGVDEDNGDVDVDGIVDDNERSTHSRNSSSAPCRLLPQVTCHPVFKYQVIPNFEITNI